MNGDGSGLGYIQDGYPALATWIGGDPDGLGDLVHAIYVTCNIVDLVGTGNR